MITASPKWAALTLFVTAGLLLTISVSRDGRSSQSDPFVEAQQIEMLIRTLEARNEESSRKVNEEQETERVAEAVKDEAGGAKSALQRWQDRVSGSKEPRGKSGKRKTKKEKFVMAKLAKYYQKGSNNTEDEAGTEKLDNMEVVDKKDPEKLRRNQKTPLKELTRDQYWPVVLKPSYGRFFKELNLDHYTQEDAEYLRSRLPVYQERAERVSRACSSRPELLRGKVKIKTLVWDTRHSPNLVWCQLPKIASSTWNAHFFSLGRPQDDMDEVHTMIDEEYEDENSSFHLHHEVFRLFPAPNTTIERNKVFINALRFMIVRHPFVRLVSAYRDKITQDDPKPVWFHYEKLQELIIKKYRPADSDEDSVHPTFQEFVSFVIDQTRGLKTRQDWRKKVNCWKPYYVSCGVCVHDMQMVLKLETLNDDTRFLATLAGLDQLNKKTMWLHNLNGTTSDTLSLEYFETLTKGQVEELYDRYRTDFDIFGYSPQEFLDRAQLNGTQRD